MAGHLYTFHILEFLYNMLMFSLGLLLAFGFLVSFNTESLFLSTQFMLELAHRGWCFWWIGGLTVSPLDQCTTQGFLRLSIVLEMKVKTCRLCPLDPVVPQFYPQMHTLPPTGFWKNHILFLLVCWFEGTPRSDWEIISWVRIWMSSINLLFGTQDWLVLSVPHRPSQLARLTLSDHLSHAFLRSCI